MPLLIKPTINCNVNCDYCYQTRLREKTEKSEYSLNEIIDQIKRNYRPGDDIVFHGGEITTLPIEDLEALLKVGFELSGQTGIQTNFYKITEDHVSLFKKYRTSIGVSIDGPWPINRPRNGGSENIRKKITETVMNNLEKYSFLHPGLICVINDEHLKPENRPLFKQWMSWLFKLGLTGGRHNPVQFRQPGRPDNTLEFIDFYLEMAEFVLSDPKMSWQPYRDIVDNLLGLGTGTCVFTKCDFYHTRSAKVILGDGSSVCCLHTAKDGKVFQRASSESFERYQLLRQTPMEYLGCNGCKYWKICYGHCPASGHDNDWRNRGIYCELMKALYEFIEKRIKGLLPNIRLVTDYEEERYEERNHPGLGEEAFKAMLPRRKGRPSSWCGGYPYDELNTNKSSPVGCSQKSDGGWVHLDHQDNVPGLSEEELLQQMNWEKTEPGINYEDKAGYLVDLGGGYKHADHSDEALSGGGE